MNGKTIIIAEAGVNHNGDLALAKRLIDSAVEAGADYVKFQTFKAEKLVTKSAQKASYQKATTEKSESQFDMIKKLELSKEDHKVLKNYCGSRIKFLSAPFDIDSVDELLELGMDYIKIPSGELTNLPFLEWIGKKKKKVILSTGMSNLKEIAESLKVLVKAGTKKKDITVLHCNTEYPTPFSDVNLKAMRTIKEKLGVNIGYSDHTAGIEVPIAAVTLGAQIIEKHFTLDKNLPGPDHKASLAPDELHRMISSIRNIEKALGSSEKKPTPSEAKNIPIARKSIVAKKKISKGEVFTKSNLTTKRPGTGISPMKWHKVLGKKAQKNYEEDDLI